MQNGRQANMKDKNFQKWSAIFDNPPVIEN